MVNIVTQITRIEQIQAVGYLHRDVKADNFLISDQNVFLIDFGLSKRYCDRNGEHIPYKEGKNLTGTARYASINTHVGIEQSRRDDLECVGHVLIYLLKGTLPWQGVRAKTKKEKYAKIKEIKQNTSIEELCNNIPCKLQLLDEFALYMKYVRSEIEFEEIPDYEYARSLFFKIAKDNKFDLEEPFTLSNSKKQVDIRQVLCKSKNEPHQQKQLIKLFNNEENKQPDLVMKTLNTRPNRLNEDRRQNHHVQKRLKSVENKAKVKQRDRSCIIF